MKSPVRGAELIAVALAAAAASEWTGEWVAGYAVIVAWIGVRLLFTDDRIPVLAAAFLYQWMQITIGLFYSTATERLLRAQVETDFRQMMVLSLTSLLALAFGLWLGIRLVRDERENREERPVAILSSRNLVLLYLASTAVQGAAMSLIPSYPTMRQILFTLVVGRLGIVFLILRRLTRPVFRPHLFALVLGFEVLIGLTSYFADFRDALVVATLVLVEIFDYRKKTHWLTAAAVGAISIALAVMWMGVRGQYRRAMDDLDPLLESRSGRVTRVQSLASEFFASSAQQFENTTDALVDRMWAIYYPALALARVPKIIPHTGGTFLSDAMIHMVTPRIIFPGKSNLVSDSEKVRRYAGIFVAGNEAGTTIAFGYVIESYIDFGIPGMYVPVFLFGLAMGAMYAWFLRVIWHRELAVAVALVVFWAALFLFERSWDNTLGNAMSLIVYLGLPLTLLDRFLSRRSRTREVRVLGGAAYTPLSQADSH